MNSKQAKEVPITEFLAYKHILPVRSDNHRPDYWYKSPFREERTASFKCNTLLNKWWDFGSGEGGNIIDLALRFGNKTVSEALQDISNVKSQIPFSFQKQEKEINVKNVPKPIVIQVLKVQPLKNKALLSYVTERAIDINIASEYCCEVYYKALGTNKHYFSIGFRNSLGGWVCRNRYFKNAISPAGITAYFNLSDALNVFEGFLDFLSWKQLYPEKGKEDAIVLNSIIYIPMAEHYFKNYKTTYLWLDNDAVGWIEKQKILSTHNNTIDKSGIYKGQKDLNEYLIITKYKKQ